MTPEFSRAVRIDELSSSQERSYEIEASEAERAALASRFGLVAIGRLTAAVRLRAEPGERMVRLAAKLAADVVQTRVVTLEPVPAHVETAFEVLYDRSTDPAGSEVLDAGKVDIVPLEGETLDMGEAVAEELALSLDPFPRAPGAQAEGGEMPQEAANRPFEILARFKAKH